MFSLHKNTPQGQKDAVLANDKTITVEAGAGTGKTWVLTERYARLLAENPDLLPNNILTLTYTEAAAGEMKARITSRIEELLEDSDNPERKREILDGLADLWISTIHSFAGRLIRESGLSLDIDPRASVITTRQEQDFWESVRLAAEFADLKNLARTFGDRDLRKIAEELDASSDFSAGVSKWGADKLRDLARSASELHASRGKEWREMMDWSDNDDLLLAAARPDVKNILAEEWHDVVNFWMDKNLPQAKKGTKADNLNTLLASLKSGAITELQFYTEIMTSDNVSGARNVKDALGCTLSEWRKSRSQKILTVTQNFDSPITEYELRMRKVLLKFCALAWGMWDNMKTKRGLLTFSDMINHAGRTINGGGVSRSFRHILVDEFQDTDTLQDSLIKSLAGESTSLFAVGDPKQSIYRFRHADPRLFAKTIRESEKNVELDTSFRTKDSLLQIINSLFSSVWVNGLGKSPAMNGLTYKRLNSRSDNEDRDGGTMPVFSVILAPHNQNNTADGRKNLAEELARHIYNWEKAGLKIWDKKEKNLRAVKFSDFAILTPSRGIYPVLEEALERFGIKSIQDKSTDYFSRGEINDVVCLLRAAADMSDDFAVAGWLMSPFSGVNEAEAVEALKLADKSARPIELIRDKFPDAYSRLEYYSLIGEHDGPAELIAIFDRNRGWLSAYKPSDRMRILRNVRLAVSLARDFQSSGTSSLVSCAEWLTRTVRSQVSYDEPAWHDDSENAVKLGTVHSAKGLEYPVTVVFDQRVQKRTETDQLRPSRELGLVFTNIPDEVAQGKEIEPKLAAWEKLLSEQGEEEEQTRLFYVAMTRAQDSLIFCGMVNDKDNTPHPNTWTKLLADNMPNLSSSYAVEIPPHVFPKLEQEQEDSLRPVETVKAVNMLRQISASSFALYEWCPFAWRRRYRQGLTLTWEAPQEKAEDFDGYTGGADVGSLVHWVLERWPESGDYEAKLDYYLHDKEVLARVPGYLRAAWRKNDNDKASQLKEWLMNFAASELGELLRTRKDILREKQFRLQLDEYTALAGAIDAVYGNNIIDYKITDIDSAPPGLYESQLDFYALALHMITGAENVNTSIAFLRQGKIEHREISDFEAIRARVADAAKFCASGPHTTNHEHCALCPFKKGCANYAGA